MASNSPVMSSSVPESGAARTTSTELPLRSSPRTMRILIALTAVALLLRLAPLLHAGDSRIMTSDSFHYLDLAAGIKAGCGFAQLSGGVCAAPETLRTPGYPLFLAVLTDPRGAVAVQALLGAATCFIVGYFAATRWGLAAGVAAEIFLALDIPSIMVGAQMMSDSLFQLLLALGIVLELLAIDADSPRSRQIFIITAAGLALGAAILVRPIGFLLPILALLPFVVPARSRLKRRLRLAAIVFFIPAAVGFGWATRNYYRAGIWALSTISTYNLYTYRAAGTIWYSEGGDFVQIQKTLISDLDLGPSQSPRYIDAHMYHLMVAKSLKIISAHPFQFLRCSLTSMLWLTIVPDRANLLAVMAPDPPSIPFNPAAADLTGRINSAIPFNPAATDLTGRISSALASPAIAALLAFQFALVLAVWAGVFRALASPIAHRGDLFVLVVIALAMLALASGPEACARYRTPAMPFLAIAAAAGWFHDIRRKLADRRRVAA
jgi:4-amino-4-deoxy-L-arabinose transferase-like glycosyltransferase